MSQDESANVASPRSEAHVEPSGDGFKVHDRADILRPIRATDVTLAADPERPDVVVAQFWNGDHLSYGAHGDVREAENEVSVQVFVGVLPEAEGRPATAIAQLQRLDIQLSKPLGDRRLVSS